MWWSKLKFKTDGLLNAKEKSLLEIEDIVDVIESYVMFFIIFLSIL